jgi:hypothetical protein
MSHSNNVNFIKNIYDESTTDTLRTLNQNLITLIKHNPDFHHIEIIQFERVPIKTGSPKSHIRVDVVKNGAKGSFFISEDFVTHLEESSEIRQDLLTVMKQIKSALEKK